MTDSIVEPELKDALDRAKDVADKIIETSKEAAEAQAPLKEMQAFGNEISEIYKDANWMRINTNLFNPKCYQGLLEELLAMQKANFETLVKNQEAMLQEATKTGKEFFESNKDLTKPQVAMANVINQALDNFDKLSATYRDQAKELEKMQSEYFQWYKKTLDTLSKQQN